MTTDSSAGLREGALVLWHDLGERLSEEVVRACRRAGASTTFCATASELGALSVHPRLVVARVRHGERRIRSAVLEIMSRLSPSTPLLLLCDESLDSSARTNGWQ